MEKEMQQNNRIALVTGANQGVGLQVAKELVANGITVLVGSRNFERGEAAAKEIGPGAFALQLDVTDRVSIDAAVEHIRKEFGRLDLLRPRRGRGRARAEALIHHHLLGIMRPAFNVGIAAKDFFQPRGGRSLLTEELHEVTRVRLMDGNHVGRVIVEGGQPLLFLLGRPIRFHRRDVVISLSGLGLKWPRCVHSAGRGGAGRRVFHRQRYQWRPPGARRN